MAAKAKDQMDVLEVSVNYAQLNELLRVAIPNRFRVLVTGDPGTGKTAAISAVAKELGYDYIEDHPTTEEPPDKGGFPVIDRKARRVDKLPIGNAAYILAATKPTVWAIEDLGSATPAMQAAYMPWIHAQVMNRQAVPQCVSIVGTSNLKGQHARVEGMLEPVKSRWHTIVRLVATMREFLPVALRLGLAQEVIGYLQLFPSSLSNFTPTSDILMQSPSPRTWEAVSRAIQMGVPKSVELATFTGSVGQGEALRFIGWLEHYRAIPPVDEIWKDPAKALIPLGEDVQVLWAYLSALAHEVTEELMVPAAVYLKRVLDKNQHELVLQTLMTIFLRKPAFIDSLGGMDIRQDPRIRKIVHKITKIGLPE